MLENYTINDLLIGKLVTVTNQGWSHGPSLTYEGPYIFYRISDNKYVEIFTETEYSYNRPSTATTRKNYKVSKNIEKNEFGKTYIEPTENILSYLTDEELKNYSNNINTTLSKKRILEIYRNMTVRNIETEKQLEILEKQYVLNKTFKHNK